MSSSPRPHMLRHDVSEIDGLLKQLRFDPIPTGASAGGILVPNTGPTTVTTFANGMVIYIPFDVAERTKLDQIIDEATIVSSAGGLFRTGIYLDDGTMNRPRDLLLDAGTINVAVGTGAKPYTLPSDFWLPIARLWLAKVAQGAPSTAATMRCWTMAQRTVPLITATNTASNFLVSTGVTGALPQVASTPNGNTSFAPATYLRVAA